MLNLRDCLQTHFRRISGSIRRLKALMVKEFYQIRRDPSSILISVVLPMILLFIYGFAVSLDFQKMPIGLVMEDTAPDAQSFAQSLIDSRYFKVTIERERRLIDQKIVEGKLLGMVVIPSYFSQFRQRQSEIAPLQVIADGTNPNTASFVQNYVGGTFKEWQNRQFYENGWQGQSLIRQKQRFWFNDSLNSRNFILPGSLAITITLIGTLLTALVVAREWERGTMESLMATSVTVTELMLGKLFSYFVLGMISFILSVFFTVFFFEVPLRGSWTTLFLVNGVFLFSALGLGLLISAFTRNQFVASQIALNTAFLPAYMLSGFLFEISSMPEWIRILTYILPARYFVSCLQTLFLAGDIWSLLWHNIAVMALIAIIFYLILIKKTVKRLD